MVTFEEQRRLLDIARRALEAQVLGAAAAAPGYRVDEPDDQLDEQIGLVCGVFVSIHRAGELRGCLGRIEPLPLARTVADLARAVADSDPRFEPVRARELGSLDIELSVLTPERRIESIEEIEVGRHGVIVEQGGRRGLLLPQVAPERAWDRLTLLEHACLKAGLRREAWQQGAAVFVFEALVFGERASRCATPGTPAE